jgi:hypothetical protein
MQTVNLMHCAFPARSNRGGIDCREKQYDGRSFDRDANAPVS